MVFKDILQEFQPLAAVNVHCDQFNRPSGPAQAKKPVFFVAVGTADICARAPRDMGAAA